MDRILYTAMSGAKQTMDRQAVVSNNLANVSTAGFRGQLHAMRAVPVQGDGVLPTRASVVAATPGSDFSAGPMNATGRDLDVALQGNAWLAVQSEDGGEAYTRRGDLQVDGDGVLNSAGRPVIGEGGPIVVPLGPVSDHGDGARLLPSLPDAALWHRLGARPWLASARGNGRVWLCGERHALEESRARAVAWDSRLLRHRGRAVQARLRRLDVAAPVAGGGAAPLSARLCAWFASLHDLDTGAGLGQRYWLAPGDQNRERTLSLLVASLSAEGLPALERRARLTLDREGLAAPAGAADLLASLALRLDLDDGDWALDARGQLLALLGGRHRRKPETLLDALLALLRARHSLRDLGRDLGLEP
ncbi:MAG TPA: hypothetical protein DEV80_07515 [Alcanivorax sp.]|nr:hypothetical protein [Alcanivorax sp.]|tara:strand:- start:39683 stop:40768 length:1086 start_codon:yes stop_codon:yes gene_type:complete